MSLPIGRPCRTAWASVSAVLLAAGLLAASPGRASADPRASVGGDPSGAGAACTTPASPDGAEPPCNPHLAPSPWAASHRNSYAQASSPLPGPAGPAAQVNVDHDSLLAAPIVLTFSTPYPDGGPVVWASTVGPTGEVFKFDPDTFTMIDHYIPQLEEGTAPQSASISGAYNVLDRDNHLIVGRERSLDVFGDATPGVRQSPIALLHRFSLPDGAFCSDQDRMVGITMTYDGQVAFATEQGRVGVVPRQPDRMTADNLVVYSINGPDCSGGPAGAVETVSNSIAADEQGGIYVVTSHAMYRIDWDGHALTQGWRATYAGAGGSGGGRLGAGSGATPTLMGTDAGDDRFVVITDGQDLMHLDLLWRDAIPDDWTPVRPGADRRIACEIPVTFGNPDAQRSLSEQSVLVRGRSAFVVNNLQQLDPVTGRFPPQFAPYSQLLSGLPGNAPRGIQRFDWDPATRTCDVAWSNPDVAIPNGIPTLSAATGYVYGIGARNDVLDARGDRHGHRRGRLHRRQRSLPHRELLLRGNDRRPRPGGLDRHLRRHHPVPAVCARRRVRPAPRPG